MDTDDDDSLPVLTDDGEDDDADTGFFVRQPKHKQGEDDNGEEVLSLFDEELLGYLILLELYKYFL